MSRQSSRTPVPDIYTALLFVGAGCMIVAVTLLLMALSTYGWETTVP